MPGVDWLVALNTEKRTHRDFIFLYVKLFVYKKSHNA